MNGWTATQGSPEDTDLIFRTDDGNDIAISDVDAGSDSVEVILTVSNGALSTGSKRPVNSMRPTLAKPLMNRQASLQSGQAMRTQHTAMRAMLSLPLRLKRPP